MSIFAGLGAVPSNFTEPLTVATVLGSIGVAAGAAVAAFSSEAFDDCSVFSFLLQPISSTPSRQRRPNMAIQVFLLFMMSLSVIERYPIVSVRFRNGLFSGLAGWAGSLNESIYVDSPAAFLAHS